LLLSFVLKPGETYMSRKPTLVHVTHEATGKIGGIGAVLKGLFTSRAYLDDIERTILISPLFTTETAVSDRLGANGKVLYSSLDGLVKTNYAESLKKVEDRFNVGIVYGKRTFIDEHTGIENSPEVILIDIRRINAEAVNDFKRNLFDEFGIQSHLYENIWEYEQYVRLALPAISALKAVGAAEHNNPTVIISHEFMGMPTALAGIIDDTYDFKTAFYAHEVATMRRIVENHPGHDTMFYNAIRCARENGLYVNDVFDDQSSFFKHPLVDASRYCDSILAVGDYAVDELRFMADEFKSANINLVYNGIPAYEISIEEKLESKEKLRLYCENLLGFKPDFIFTHVTRMVQSKGLWRDLQVLGNLEERFRAEGKTAVMFLLSTEVSQRHSDDIYKMESSYNWPVAHREGMPDLSGGEASFYTGIQEFNAKSRNIKIVFINQFGFCQENCGRRMPKDMEFMDIRKGTDVEFGQSIYEPFGIAPLEPLSFGGLCVVSNVSGCGGFVKDVTGGEYVKNVIIADYTTLDADGYTDIEDILQIGRDVRNQIENRTSKNVALEILARLPKGREAIEEMIRAGYRLAKHMSWETVFQNYVSNSLQEIIHKQYRRRLRMGA